MEKEQEEKKILVTGASGFVGGYLIKKLNSQGYKVRCFIRKTSNRDLIEKLNLEYFIGDMTDYDSLEKATRDVDCVIHLAALVGSDYEKENEEINVKGSENLVAACKKNKVSRVIVISSINVTMQHGGVYGKTKLEADKRFLNSSLDIKIIRPSLILGKGSKQLEQFKRIFEKIPFFPIIGDGKQRKQPVYVGDVVDTIIAVLEKKNTVNQIFYIAGAESISYEDFARALMKKFDKKKICIRIPAWVIILGANMIRIIFRKKSFNADQIKSITEDINIDISSLKELGIKPKSFQEIMELI